MNTLCVLGFLIRFLILKLNNCVEWLERRELNVCIIGLQYLLGCDILNATYVIFFFN